MSTEMLLRFLLFFMIIVRTLSMGRQTPSPPRQTSSSNKKDEPEFIVFNGKMQSKSSSELLLPTRQNCVHIICYDGQRFCVTYIQTYGDECNNGSGTSIWSGGGKFGKMLKEKVKDMTYTDDQCVVYCKERHGYFFNTDNGSYEHVSTTGTIFGFGITCSCYVSHNLKQFIINKFGEEKVAEDFASSWSRGFREKKAKSQLNKLANRKGLTIIEFLTYAQVQGILRQRMDEETSKLRRQMSDVKKVELTRQASFQRRIESLKSELQTSRDEVRKLEGQLVEKNQEIARIRGEGAAKVEEIRILQNEYTNKVALLDENKTSMAELQKELDKIKELHAKKVQELNDLSNQLSTSEQDRSQIRKELANTKQELKTSKAEAENLREEVAALKAEASKPFFKRMCGPCFGGGATKSTKKPKTTTNGRK